MKRSNNQCFWTNKNLTNSSQNLKSVQISWPCIQSFIFLIFFAHLLAFKNSMTKFRMLKDRQNRPFNDGGDAKPLKTWSDSSSLQQAKILSLPGNFRFLWTFGLCRAIFDLMEFLELPNEIVCYDTYIIFDKHLGAIYFAQNISKSKNIFNLKIYSWS